jgi:hypothetical protein
MNFIDGKRGGMGIVVAGSSAHPFLVPPRVFKVPDDGSGLGGHFVEKGKGIGLIRPVAVITGLDMELVGHPSFDPGDKAFPDSRLSPGPKGVAGWVPPVKISHHRHPFGIGGPDREARSLPALRDERVGAHFFIQAKMGPLVEQVEVTLREQTDSIPHRIGHLNSPQDSANGLSNSEFGFSRSKEWR